MRLGVQNTTERFSHRKYAALVQETGLTSSTAPATEEPAMATLNNSSRIYMNRKELVRVSRQLNAIHHGASRRNWLRDSQKRPVS